MTERVQICRCGATFVQRPHHKTGKPAPITTYVVVNGNVAVNTDETYRIVSRHEVYDGPRYVNHFTDCSYAGSFKRTE